MVEGEGSIIRTKQRYTDLIDVRKKNNLKTHKNDVAYLLMKIIKNQLDPKGIMNPGKVLF